MDTVLASVAHQPLPPEMPPLALVHRAGYRARAISRPATEFTGDLYFTAEARRAYWFAVGDFSGHGLRAAVFMAMIQEALEDLVNSPGAGPADIVAGLDRMLRDESPRNRFATIVVGRAEADGSVEIVNAGHCPPILARAGREPELIGSHGPIIGLVPSPRWHGQTVHLAPADRLVLYTDGLIEAENDRGEPYGVARFRASLRNSQPETPLESFVSAAELFAGRRATDDITLFELSRQ